MILGLVWVVEAASLSILCGAAAGPFRLYGGSLLFLAKGTKTARSRSVGPYAGASGFAYFFPREK